MSSQPPASPRPGLSGLPRLTRRLLHHPAAHRHLGGCAACPDWDDERELAAWRVWASTLEGAGAAFRGALLDLGTTSLAAVREGLDRLRGAR